MHTCLTLNCIWWWISSLGILKLRGASSHSLNTITLRYVLIHPSPIYGLNRCTGHRRGSCYFWQSQGESSSSKRKILTYKSKSEILTIILPNLSLKSTIMTKRVRTMLYKLKSNDMQMSHYHFISLSGLYLIKFYGIGYPHTCKVESKTE